jgi:CarD family transcriptional regulator
MPSSTRPRKTSSPSTGWGAPARGRFERVFGPCRRSTSSTGIREPDGRNPRPSRLKEAEIPELATEEATDIEHELGPVECNYEVGDNVVYPHHGAGVVLKKETKDLLGEKRDYLTIKILHNDMTVMVPCENAHRAGLRRVIDGEEVEKVIAVLTGEVSDMPKNWNRRFKHNREKIKTGNVFELAEVVRNLAIREWEKGLSTGEKQMYTRAKKILASEFMYALGKDEEGAEAYLDELLEERFGATASA